MLSITETSSTITINGWSDTVTLSKTNMNLPVSGNASLPVLTVAGDSWFNKSGFASGRDSTDTNIMSVTAFNSYTQNTGTDNYGTYLELALSLSYKVVDTDTPVAVTVALRFYAGCPLYSIHPTSFGTTVFTFDHIFCERMHDSSIPAQTQWFTTNQDFGETTVPTGWPAPPSTWYNNTTAWTTMWIASMCWFTGSYYYSNAAIGVGPYIDPTSTNYDTTTDSFCLMDDTFKNWFKSDRTWSAIGHKQGGFVFTSIPSWQGCLEYNKWLQRNIGFNSSEPALFGLPYLPGLRSTWAYDTGDVAGGYADVTSNGYPFSILQVDAGWVNNPQDVFTSDSDFTMATQFVNYLGTGENIAAWIKAQGYIAGCWVSAYHGISPWTTAGQAQIQGIAQAIYNYGFQYAKIDQVYQDQATMFAWVKLFRDEIKSLNPNFLIESHQAYLSCLVDVVRTNDVLGLPSGWQTYIKTKNKIALVHSPNKQIQCDMWGGDFWYTNTSAANILAHTNMSLGVGVPFISLCQYMFNNYGDLYNYGGTSATAYAQTQYTDVMSTVVSLFQQWNSITAGQMPVRSITNGWANGFSTQLTYPNGNTINWDETTGNLTFGNVATNTTTTTTISGSTTTTTTSSTSTSGAGSTTTSAGSTTTGTGSTTTSTSTTLTSTSTLAPTNSALAFDIDGTQVQCSANYAGAFRINTKNGAFGFSMTSIAGPIQINTSLGVFSLLTATMSTTSAPSTSTSSTSTSLAPTTTTTSSSTTSSTTTLIPTTTTPVPTTTTTTLAPTTTTTTTTTSSTTTPVPTTTTTTTAVPPLLYDSFAGANGSAVNSSNWTVTGSSSNFYSGSSWTIENNAEYLYIASLNGSNAYKQIKSASTYAIGSGHYILVTITDSVLYDSSYAPTITIGYIGNWSGTNLLQIAFNPNDSSTNNIIWSSWNGSGTHSSGHIITQTAGNTQTYQILLTGASTASLYIDGTLAGSFTHTASLSGTGNVGFDLQSGNLPAGVFRSASYSNFYYY